MRQHSHTALVLLSTILATRLLPAAAATAAPAPPLPLAELREDVGRNEVRLLVGQDRYKIRHVRLDPDGVTFDSGDLRGVPSGAYYKERLPASLPSPIGWDRIDGIETRCSNTLRGTVAGALLAIGVTGAVASANPDATAGWFLAGAIPAAVLVGVVVGAFTTHSKRIWQRPSAAS